MTVCKNPLQGSKEAFLIGLQQAGVKLALSNQNFINAGNWTALSVQTDLFSSPATNYKKKEHSHFILPLLSNNAISIDFDIPKKKSIGKHLLIEKEALLIEFVERLKQELPRDLLKKMYIERSKSGGIHWVFKLPVGSEALKGTKEKIERKEQADCTIEILKAGQSVTVYPTKGYDVKQGELRNLQELTQSEYNILIEALRNSVEITTSKEVEKVIDYAEVLKNDRKAFDSTSEDLIKRALTPIRECGELSKHDNLLKSANTLGGHVPHLLSYDEAFRRLLNEVKKKQTVESEKEAKRTIEKGLKWGQNRPHSKGTYKRANDKYYKLREAVSKNIPDCYRDFKPHHVNRFLLESRVFKEIVDGDKRESLLIGSTGIGKTFAFLQEAKLFRREKDSENIVWVLAVPYISIAKQIQAEEKAAYNGVQALHGNSCNRKNLTKLVWEDKEGVICCTYDQLEALAGAIKRCDKKIGLLAIDEAHNKAIQYGFRSDAIEGVQSVCNDVDFVEKVVNITATPLETMLLDNSLKKILVTSKKKQSFDICVFTYKERMQRQAILNRVITSIGEGKGVILMKVNDKKKIEALKDALIEDGYLAERQIAAIYSKDEYDEILEKLLTDSLIPEGIRLVMTTSKINDGVNVNNENIDKVILVDEVCPQSLIQYIGRPRKLGFNSTKVKVELLYSNRLNGGFEPDVRGLKQRIIKLAEAELKDRSKEACAIDELTKELKSISSSVKIPKFGTKKNASTFRFLVGGKISMAKIDFIVKSVLDTNRGRVSVLDAVEKLADHIEIPKGEPIHISEDRTSKIHELGLKAERLEKKAKEEAKANTPKAFDLMKDDWDKFAANMYHVNPSDMSLKANIRKDIDKIRIDSYKCDEYIKEHGEVLKSDRALSVYLNANLLNSQYWFSRDAVFELPLELFESPDKMKAFKRGLEYHVPQRLDYLMSRGLASFGKACNDPKIKTYQKTVEQAGLSKKISKTKNEIKKQANRIKYPTIDTYLSAMDRVKLLQKEGKSSDTLKREAKMYLSIIWPDVEVKRERLNGKASNKKGGTKRSRVIRINLDKEHTLETFLSDHAQMSSNRIDEYLGRLSEKVGS